MKTNAMRKKISFILRYLVVILPFTAFSQGHDLPVTIALFNESTAIPYTRFFTTPVHPGIMAGTEFTYKTGDHGRLFQTANLGYYYHNYLNQAILINSELGYAYRFDFGLAPEALLGIGYMQSFATSEEYQFNDGQYKSGADFGDPRLTVSLSIGVGYYVNPDVRTSPEIFLRYQSWVEYPYSPGFIPLMTHISLQAGVKFFIKIKTHEK
jgi:hypothetical protein